MTLWRRTDARVDELLARRGGQLARDRQFAAALRSIAASMRTGATLRQSFAAAAARGSGPVAHACAEAAARIELGYGVEAAAADLAARLGTAPARLFADVVAIQHRRGGDLAGPCHRLATLLHERSTLDAEARSATAQARFSARAVLAIPALLGGIGVWRSPELLHRLLAPGTVLLALPGLLLVLVGAVVANRIARRAGADVGAASPASTPTARASDLRARLHRVAGSGPRSRASARLAGVALVLAGALLFLGGHPSTTTVAGSAALVVTAAAWPWSDRARRRRADQRIARGGTETLLEVSIALFAAGATAHEVACRAPARVPEPLRSALAPGVHRVELGRSIASAFGELSVVAAAPLLDGWLHAVCSTAELGAAATPTLEQLLRDARSARREQIRSAAATAAPRMQLALVLLVVPGIMWLMLLVTVGGLLGQLRASGVA